MKLTLILLLSTIMNLAQAAEFIPEASGATRVGDSLIIAGDEEPESVWMVEGQGSKLVKTKVKGASWDDMEGLATVDAEKFFATTSHSRTKKGKRKPEREQLMLMSKNGKKINALHIWSLREDALAQLEKSHGQVLDMDTVEAASPDEGGFNIEGLAYHSGKLYLGLRSPVTSKGDALVLVIKNADAMLNGAAPVFEQTMTVSLGGKGIRSLDTYAAGLLVLSGSTDDTDQEFGVDHLVLGSGTLKSFILQGFENLLRPEGIVAESDGSVTLVQDFEEPQNQDIIVRLQQ